MSMGDGKAKNVIEYLDNLIEKGKATPEAIRPLKIAFTKVLQTIDGESWGETEVDAISVEDYMARFANLTMGKYASDSLTVYKSRVNKVVTWYRHFLDTPGWAPDVQKRNRTTKEKKEAIARKQNTATHPMVSLHNDEAPRSMSSTANTANRILYPYPLMDGQLIHISLPLKVSKQDAKRIGAFIESIAIDEPQAGVNRNE